METNYDIPHSRNEEEDIHQQEMLKRNPYRIIKPGDPDFERIAKEIMENQQHTKKAKPSTPQPAHKPAQKSAKKLINCKSCGAQSRNYGSGLCPKCYRREELAGTLDANYPRHYAGQKKESCAECGTVTKIESRGMCRKCYQRWYYHQKRKTQTTAPTQRATEIEKAKIAGNQRVEQAKENLRKILDIKKEARAGSPAAATDAHATTPEPPPEQNSAAPVYKRLINAIEERAEMGQQKYGTHLQPHNGRNALVDALQESLDMNMYQMQYIIELEDKLATIRQAAQ